MNLTSAPLSGRFKCLAAASLLMAALSAVPASATVLDFEDISFGGGRANFPTLGIENTYHGFQWPSESGGRYWAVVDNTDSQFNSVGAYSGDQALWNWSDGPVRSIIFNALTDVNGAYFNVFAAGQSWGSNTVQFAGYDASNNLIGTSAILILNDSTAHPGWQWLAANLSGVKRLEILATDTNGGFGGGWWAMDDLTLNESASVPDSGSTGLLGLLGVSVLFCARLVRRKN